MPTIIALIRHGETEWNRTSRWQGHTDIPLSAAGILQARCLSSRFEAETTKFHALYSSDLRRAMQTAEVLGLVQGLRPNPVKELRELDVGKWSGLYDHEVAARFPEEWRRVRADEDIPRGGGESMANLYTRAGSAFEAIAARHQDEKVGIVTHNGVIRALLVRIREMAINDCNDIGAIQNCSMTVVKHAAGKWEVERFNDTTHLEGFTPPPDMLAL